MDQLGLARGPRDRLQPLVRVVDVGGQRGEDVRDPVATETRPGPRRVRRHRAPRRRATGRAACPPPAASGAQLRPTTASTTSFMVTPLARWIALISAIGSVAVAKLRRAVSAPLKGVRGTSSSGRGTLTDDARRCRITAATALRVRETNPGSRPIWSTASTRASRSWSNQVGVGSRRLHAARPVACRPRVRAQAVDDVAEQGVGGHAVGQRVVHLGDHRDPVVTERLADVHLPQRTGAVQRRTGHPADQRLEALPCRRAPGPRGRTRDGPGPRSRSVTQSGWLRWNGAGSARRRSGGSSSRRARISSVSRVELEGVRRLEQRDLERVHVHGRRLHVEVAGVDAFHAVHVAKSGSSGARLQAQTGMCSSSRS